MNERERAKRFRKEQTRIVKIRTRIQRDTAAEITRQLNNVKTRIREILAAAPSDYQAWSLPQLDQAVRQALAEFEAGAAGALGSSAGSSWEAGVQLIDSPIDAGGIRIAAILPEIDTRQLRAMRTFMTGRIKDISTTIANRINSEMGLVMIGAQTPGEAVGNIATTLKSGRRRAITIIRTELGRAFSTATHQRQQQAREHLSGLRKQWRRSGKIHSRLQHDSIDGQVRDVDTPFTLGNGVLIMYPRDPSALAAETINCGCESLPYMETWDVKNPGRVPFTDNELALNARKREMQQTGFAA